MVADDTLLTFPLTLDFKFHPPAKLPQSSLAIASQQRPREQLVTLPRCLVLASELQDSQTAWIRDLFRR